MCIDELIKSVYIYQVSLQVLDFLSVIYQTPTIIPLYTVIVSKRIDFVFSILSLFKIMRFVSMFRYIFSSVLS